MNGFFPRKPVDWSPYAYQRKAMKWLVERGAAALFLDPGLGKTAITLGAFKALRRRKLVNNALVIAPLRVCYAVWPDEVQKWKDFSGIKVAVLHGPRKNEVVQEQADIYVINPEGLEWLLADQRRFKSLNVDVLVVDELTKFKHTRTKRFKMLKPFLDKFKRRWGLTGTPAANGLLDLFGQIFVLDQGRSFGRYVTHYKSKYFEPADPNGWKWRLKAGSADAIYERVRDLALRMNAEDLLDLPELMNVNLSVDLPATARRMYDQLEDELVSAFDGEIITAANMATSAIKLRQVASGAVYKTEDIVDIRAREWLKVHDAKLDALEELVDELQGQPLVVAYDFQHELERIRERLGSEVPAISGGLSAKRAAEIIASWNSGELPLLLGHPAAMGHGLNLQGSNAAHVCWFSTPWDLELYDQTIRRIYRQGNEAKRVFVYHIVARDTIDQTIMFALQSKIKVQSALFDALTAMRRRRTAK